MEMAFSSTSSLDRLSVRTRDEDDIVLSAGSSSMRFDFDVDASFWTDRNVKVIIRVRPLRNSEDKCVRQESCWAIAWTGPPCKRFTFDFVADENVSQEKLFRVAGLPMVENCLGGYNSCMFAYGQTGSGKTYTMLGDFEEGTLRDFGMIPRVFERLFTRIQKEKEARRDEKLTFTCKCTFLEIYNEQLLDLLEQSSNNLQERERAMQQRERERERAMQERDELKRMLSSFGQRRGESKLEFDCPEKLIEVSGMDHIESGELPMSVEVRDLIGETGLLGLNLQDRSHAFEKPAKSGGVEIPRVENNISGLNVEVGSGLGLGDL